MKLFFLCNNMKSINGVERVLSQRLSLLAEYDQYDVYLLTYNQYGAPFSFPISTKVHVIDLATRYINRCSYHGFFQYWDRYVSKLRFVRELYSCLDKIKPDIITCVDIHIVDLQIIVNYKTDAVKVVECHCGLSSYFAELNRISSSIKRFHGLLLKKEIVRTIKRFDKLIVMTESEKKDWCMDDKVVFIPNMLVAYPSDVHCCDKLRKNVISVGRYAYQKGYDMLLYAWKTVQDKYPDWSLHIYGSRDGDMGDYDQLEKIKEKNQLNGVFLHPATNDVYSKYNESDFYVMSSRFESFGLVLIEAMSCGLPVISFDCKYGPHNIIHDGINGTLVPLNNIDALSTTICSMIENVEMRQAMAINARQESNKYHPDNIMPLWHAFYKSLEKVHPIDA